MTRRLAPLLAATLLLGPLASRAEDPPRLAGSEVAVPKRTHFVQPTYPPEAVARGLRGIVILDLVIGSDGKVISAEVTRSVPPFDEAALAAAKQWEFEVTKVDGQPVSVRLSVPISFALRLPDVKREPGIPELRQGITPAFPAQAKQRKARVVAQVTLDASGAIAEAEIVEGESPFSDAFLQALRTWQFALKGEEERISFRAEAIFEQAKPGTATVDLALSEPRRLASSPTAEPVQPEPSPAASLEPTPAATPVPRPSPAPKARPTPPPPPVEVLRAPAPAAPTPPLPVSAIRDVTLGSGVPDLVRGRRPVPPPLARMGGVIGKVTVHFSVDTAGSSNVSDVDGPELLAPAAKEVAVSWQFRRTSPERLQLVATFEYRADGASAQIQTAE
jgi:TonB family protein